MVKINFQNNITKANADTFNTMQDNIEDAINNVVATIPQQNTAPASPSEDDLWIDTSTNTLKRYNGSSWVVIGSVSITVDDTVSTSSTNPIENQAITNYINTMNEYSTTEVDTGKKWIDGKSIYRKCLTGTTPTGSVSSTLITSVAKIISYNIVVKRNGVDQYHPLSTAMINYDSSHAFPLFLSSGGDVLLYIINSSYQGQEYYGWVEYTKTS